MTVIDPIAPELHLPARYQMRAVLKETPAIAVYRVFDCSDKRDEAIKILRHEVHELQQLLQFKSEFSTLVSLEHPSIVRVFDFGLLRDRFPYFTMEYFAGKRISEFFDGKAVEHPRQRRRAREDHGLRGGDSKPSGPRPPDPRDAPIHGA